MFLLCVFPHILLSQSLFTEKAEEYNLIHSYRGTGAGGALSLVDFDSDGYDDITLASADGEKIVFYRNIIDGFQAIDLEGIDTECNNKQILWVDFDNDLDMDLFTCCYEAPNKLYQNNGSMVFEDISEKAGLSIDTFRNIGASFADVDRDGLLDLYYVQRSIPGQNLPAMNILYLNKGNGEFLDVTQSNNLSDPGRLPFCNIVCDFNNDKWPDIYIANDRESRNTLFLNQKDFFLDVSEVSKSGLRMQGMNAAVSDFDHDGDFDLYITNNEVGNKFLRNDQEVNTNPFPIFTEIASAVGAEVNAYCWGANFLDCNNDGYEDLYVSAANIGSDGPRSRLLLQNNSHEFEIVNTGFEADTIRSYCNAIADFNDDGYPDIVVQNSNPFPLFYWENNAQNNNWIKIKLLGVLSNRNAIGSRVEIYSDSTFQQKMVTCGNGFLGQNSTSLLFGMENKDVLDSLIILWPTGHKDSFYDITVNSTYQYTEGQSTNGNINIDDDIQLWSPEDTTSTKKNLKNNFVFKLTPNPAIDQLIIEFIHTEAFKFEIISLEGRILSVLENQNTIEIGWLKSGLYFARITMDGKTHTKTFIKL